MRKLIVALCVICGIVVVAQGEPTFEVATIKLNKSGDGAQFFRNMPGGRITVTNMPVRALVTFAYQLGQFQLVGGPPWITGDHFDIVAKLEGEPQPFVLGTPNPAMLAMRTLLADRFKLKLHKETREMDVYALVMAKPGGGPGPELKQSATDCAAIANARRGGPPPGPPPGPPSPNDPFPCGMMGMPGMIRMGGMPISQVPQMLSGMTGRLVLDRTGLTGNWDFMLKFAAEQRGQPPPGERPLPAIDPDAPSIFTALQEQLGLKLESTKAPVEVTVIDSIEHPTED